MSYTREYEETVTGRVYKTVYVDYPASENGGSTSYIIDEEVDIPVHINIHVDTDPFDASVESCGDHVNLLTGAIVATEAAEILSKEINSKKVANSIIDGFFSYIKSEISQQIAELSLNIEAELAHLKELAESCLAKKKQMEGDYNRISSRYVKIFEDLNNELSNRIFEMDKPAFQFKKETNKQNDRSVENDLVNTVAIFGLESGDLLSKINVSIAKKRALDTLLKAKSFLWQQKFLSTTIQQSMLNENEDGPKYAPVCFLEMNNDSNQIDRRVFNAEFLTVLDTVDKKTEIINEFISTAVKWKEFSQEDEKKIVLYFNTELNTTLVANDNHAVRVKEMIQKMAKINLINRNSTY